MQVNHQMAQRSQKRFLCLSNLYIMNNHHHHLCHKKKRPSTFWRRFIIHKSISHRSHNRRSQHTVKNEITGHHMGPVRGSFRDLHKQMTAENTDLDRDLVHGANNLAPHFIDGFLQTLGVFFDVVLGHIRGALGGVDFVALVTFDVVANKLHHHGQCFLEIVKPNDLYVALKHLKSSSVTSEQHVGVSIGFLALTFDQVGQNGHGHVVRFKHSDKRL
mmetsp:Transcript_30413/g.47220  ORF Transcript_30413/g.47220 Transcript_30413/m.47220 type:complete len:217 (-) Transcript_30413:4182-4832(-)